MTLPVPDGEVAQPVITVSIGVATTIPPQRGTWNHLVESADAELYRGQTQRTQPGTPGPARRPGNGVTLSRIRSRRQ
jgi:hypothetical protein